MSLVVLGGGVSPFVRKVRVALAEKGLDYQHDPVNPFAPPAGYREISPLGKIPAFKDGDRTLCDSSVICAYLEKKHPSPALLPAEPAELAKALFLEEYADTRANETIGGIFFERFVKPNILRQATDEARVRELQERGLPPLLDYLESQAPEDRDSVLARFSLADAALGAQLANLGAAGVEIDARRWPRTVRYLRALLERPSFKTAMAQ